ncbi:uncharacterized protein LOC129599292 isoform X2 [Paramacrobiotus metropolitanus]|uniref:uncharacterized protein LOC129599292 isoform X2 n=1 Tax=Paramacrobiotus metropolitanus TaxID=2943436 RepID=UPI00244618CC|nr:uncharacterized protein LOC129599292 isoform X2 [Paramacrobiotus metropolitanus]
MPATVTVYENSVSVDGEPVGEAELIYAGEDDAIVRMETSKRQKQFACKHFTKELPDKYRDWTRTERLRTLENPYVVNYYYAGPLTHDRVGVLMEYYPMRDLEMYEGKFTVFQTLQFVHEVLQGIAFLHANGLAHGNLCTDTILLQQTDEREFPSPKITGIERVPPIVKESATKPDLSKDMTKATAEDFEEQCAYNIWNFGDIFLFMLNSRRISYGDLLTVPDLEKNPYYTQDTLPLLAIAEPLMKLLLPSTPPGIVDLIHLCYRMHSFERPTAQDLMDHYIFAIDLPYEKREQECIQRIGRFVGTEYYQPMSDRSDKQYYSKVKRMQRFENNFYVITVDNAVGRFGKRLIWESKFPCLLDSEYNHADRGFLNRLFAFRQNKILPLCRLKHQSIYPMLNCHLRYIHNYISAVYQFEVEPYSECLEKYLAKTMLPWNYIKIYCRQLLEGLIFLEENRLQIHGIGAYMVALCSRHIGGTFLQAKLQTTFHLDELLLESFAKHGNNSELLRNHRGVGRFVSPEAALLPSISGLLHASEKQQVWGMGHILLQLATVGTLRFEKATQNSETEIRVVEDDVSNAEIMHWLRSGWRPHVPLMLADDIRRVIKLCFLPKDERPSLQELVANEFFRTAMPLEAVVNSTTKPVFCMRPQALDALAEVFGGERVGAKKDEAQSIRITAASGNKLDMLVMLLLYRNFDCDRPLSVELQNINDFKQATFSPANDLIVELIVSGLNGLDCEIFRELNLPNLLSLRLYNCQDVVLKPGCLQMFSKLRCLEVPECTFVHFDENALREMPQLEMVILDENAAAPSPPTLIEQIRCADKFAGLKRYLQHHVELIRPRAAGDVWRYQMLINRSSTECALHWLGSTTDAVELPAICIQIGLHGEFRLQSSDNTSLVKVITVGDLEHEGYNRELRQLCELNHPNLVSLSTVPIMPEGPLTLRMTYYNVGSLGDFICHNRQAPPTLQQIMQLTHGILLGLQFVHSTDRKPSRALHGAIHPWNIMLEPDEAFFTPKLSDMDNHLQKLYMRQPFQKHRHTYSRYARFYMSPEMLACTAEGRFEQLTGKTDIWSFGRVVLYLFDQRKQIAMETQTIIPKFDISANMFYPVDDRLSWLALTSDAVPPAVIDLLYLTHKVDPRDRPDAAILLRHLGYQKGLSLRGRLSRHIRTSLVPTMSACIYPPTVLFRHTGCRNQNGNTTAIEIRKEWLIPKSALLLQSKDIVKCKLNQLVQHMLIKTEAVIKFVLLDLQLETNALRFSGFCYCSSEIRTYCIDILNGLQYLRDNSVECEPITTDSVYLCNLHGCGIYQTAKIIITPSLLNWFSPGKRLEILSQSTGYAFAPEEISGYSTDQVHNTNIWHFGQILLEMTRIRINGLCFDHIEESHDDLAKENSATTIIISKDQLIFEKVGMRPIIPWYFPDQLQRVLQRCFAEAVHRPTANQLQSFSSIPESLFYCSPSIQYKILYNEWPRFSRRAISVEESEAWRNALICRTTTSFHQLRIAKLKAKFWPDNNILDMMFVFQIRYADRDYPITVHVSDEASFSRRNFSPISDLIVKLVIEDITNFDCCLLRGLHLYNLLSLQFKNCSGIRIAQADLSGFTRLRTLKFTRSTLLNFEIGALSQLDYLCNLDLTGDLRLQMAEAEEEYIERLLSCQVFKELRAFVQHHRELIQRKDTMLLDPYRMRNLGHLDFLL